MSTSIWNKDPLRTLDPSVLRMIQTAVKDYIDANDELHSYLPENLWHRERPDWVALLMRIDQAFGAQAVGEPKYLRSPLQHKKPLD